MSELQDSNLSFECPECGETHEIQLCFGNNYPDYYYTVPPDERERRVEMETSLCVIDKEHFFIRGRITIPIVDYKDDLLFNVWTTLSEGNFRRMNEVWHDPNRIHEPPYFGWLQTRIPTYPNTLNIKTMVHTNELGFIPNIEVIEEGHLLWEDQQNGITLEKAKGIATQIMHPSH